VESGKAAKEAIPDLLRAIASGTPVGTALEQCAPGIRNEDLQALISKIVDDRADFVRERGPGAVGPLMGVVMEKVRGSADGRVVSELLKNEINRVLSS